VVDVVGSLISRCRADRLDSEEARDFLLFVSSGILLSLGVGLSIPGSNGLAWLLFGAILGSRRIPRLENFSPMSERTWVCLNNVRRRTDMGLRRPKR
jgi:hypothetical protein